MFKSSANVIRGQRVCMAAIAEILYVWAKVVNWREARRKRKKMQQYQTPSHDFVYFRPVEGNDLRAIQKLEVPYIMAATPASITCRVALLLPVWPMCGR